MRGASTLVFALTVTVHCIVCAIPEAKRGENPWELPDVRLWVVRIPAAKLPGVWTIYGEEDGVTPRRAHPVIDYLDVVVKGSTIIGSDYHYKLIPLLVNSENGLQSITLQYGDPPHTPRVYYLPHPIYRLEFNPHNGHVGVSMGQYPKQFGLNEPLPPNALYEPSLLHARAAAPQRHLDLDPRYKAVNSQNPNYF